jgi:hypothetical protein
VSRERGNPLRPWWVEGYYGPGGRKGSKRNPNRGRPGELEGDIAIATEHGSESSRDMEIAALRMREDIGTINHGYNDGRGIHP